MKSCLIVPVIFVSACAVQLSAAEPARSVNELVAEALEKNPELKFYETELAAAKAGEKLAALRPSSEFSADVGRKSTPGAEGVAWSASLMMPFEWPGRIGLRKAIANRDVELANLGYERFRVALASEIRLKAYGLFVAQEKATAAGEVADRFKALREVLVQRDPAGLTPLLEMRVIEATELNARRTASEAELAARSALLELNLLRGAPADAELVVAQIKPAFDTARKHGELVALAMKNNFELRVRETELAQQGFIVQMAANESRPTISAGPVVSEERADGTERVIGLAVSIPLGTSGRSAGNAEVAKAREAQAQTSLLVTRRDIERRVIAAAQSYEARTKAMADWRADAVQHFREAAELADRHYRLGSVPVATYVELQKQYFEAVESLLDTKLEALQSAAEIEQLTGLPQPLVTSDTPGDTK